MEVFIDPSFKIYIYFRCSLFLVYFRFPLFLVYMYIIVTITLADWRT